MNKAIKPRLVCAAAGLLLLLSACGGGTGDAEVSARSSGQANESAHPWSAATPPLGETETLLAEGAKLNKLTLNEAESEAVAADQQSGVADLNLLTLGQIAPKSAYTSGAVWQKASDKLVPVWRFYNGATGAHFFTRNPTERDNVIANMSPPKGNFTYEGEAFKVASAPSPGLSPVHRFYNTRTGVHFYTISDSERANITNNLPQFAYEGIAYYASKVNGAGTAPFYRFFLPAKGFHFYTANQKERDNIVATLGAIYTYEGPGYAVLQSSWQPEATPRNIVIVGNQYTAGTSEVIGKMWVNGVESNLPVGEISHRSVATGVAFAGDNFIVSGYYPFNTGPNKLDGDAKLWHNGTVTQSMNLLPLTYDYETTDIKVSGSDIYVSGKLIQGGGRSKPVLWKNNNIIEVANSVDQYTSSSPSAIAVSGNDVYLAGQDDKTGLSTAVLWKNGLETRLSNTFSFTTDVHVFNSNVYVTGLARYSGSVGNTAVLWKNGIAQNLTDGTKNNSIAYAVDVNDLGDTFVAGVENFNGTARTARLWKNGVLQSLEGAGPSSWAQDVVVAGNDVYVIGFVEEDSGGNRFPALWINGSLKKLSITKSLAFPQAIAVK